MISIWPKQPPCINDCSKAHPDDFEEQCYCVEIACWNMPDSDWDGYLEECYECCASLDNCPTTANSNQADGDCDGLGDACDSALDDTDIDGVDDRVECPERPSIDIYYKDYAPLSDWVPLEDGFYFVMDSYIFEIPPGLVGNGYERKTVMTDCGARSPYGMV